MKKKSLREHVDEAQAQHKGKCTSAGKRCPIMAAVLAIHAENDKRPAFEVAPMFSMKTGKPTREMLVYFVRSGEYTVVNYCPYCGTKVGAGKKP